MSDNRNINALVKKMSLRQKATLCCGVGSWNTAEFKKLGIPALTLSDGPHGLRKKTEDSPELGITSGIRSTCFPPAATLACSWDRKLAREVGSCIGEECQQEDVQILLGPGANIKRTPLCGRNFEYFSEDPYLSSQMAGGHIDGVQSQGVGTSLKHFLANNQETDRLEVDEIISERALREIYLASFESVVREHKPSTVMCSYNRINGVLCSENHRTLTDILRGEWGFEGVVVSDWGAVDERQNALRAGIDLEMPTSQGVGVRQIMRAIRRGKLSRAELDIACERMLRMIFSLYDKRRPGLRYDADAHHACAARVLKDSAVLLRNTGLLPLKPSASIAVIGDMADQPRIQGAGSSQVSPTRQDGILDALRAATPDGAITFAKGYMRDDYKPNAALIAQAVEAAAGADNAIIVAGLPERFESEGFDREHMRIPDSHTALISAVAKAQPNTIVVLINGSPIEMEWADNVAAIMEIYLGGQAIGSALADLIYGKCSPCGRLAETFPLYAENCPAEITARHVKYSEGIFVGYRYYLTRKLPVRFPFGFGLSYTNFGYRSLSLSVNEINDTDVVDVTVEISNDGTMDGSEVVQIYVEKLDSLVKRPLRELRAFTKLVIPAGKKRETHLTLDKRAFAYFDEELGDWRVEEGDYLIELCRDCEHVELSERITVHDTCPQAKKRAARPQFDRHTTVLELMDDEVGSKMVEKLLEIARSANFITDDMYKDGTISMVYNSPLRTVFNMWLSIGSELPIKLFLYALNSSFWRKRLLHMLETGGLDRLLHKLTKNDVAM